MQQGGGAPTPEELETLLEDALLLGDGDALASLFDEAAAFAETGVSPVTGAGAVAQHALALWSGDRPYVADARHVARWRDLALLVGDRTITVVRRDRDGLWRFAIVLYRDESRNA